MNRRLYILLPLAVMALMALLLCFIDPMNPPVPLPRCPIKMFTGFDCPGCGSTRALHALLHGRPDEAWRFNPWLPPALLFALLALVADLRGGPWAKRVLSPPMLGIFVVLTLLWGVVRNL